MDMKKNIIFMIYQYLKEYIQKEEGMEQEKNMIIIVIYNMMEIIIEEKEKMDI